MIKKIDINFDWRYTPDFKEEYIATDFDDSSFLTVQIPHSNIEVPYNNFDEKIYQFESCYRKQLWIDSISADERVYIKFNAVMTYAKVYLNGHYIGDHKGGYTPFRLDLTDYAIGDGYNTLVVYVDSNERKDIPPFGFVIDYLTYGGIYREVSLEYRNNIHIENTGVKTKDVLTKEPKLDIDMYFYNQKKTTQNLDCNFILIKDGIEIYKFNKQVQLNSKLNEIVYLSTENSSKL